MMSPGSTAFVGSDSRILKQKHTLLHIHTIGQYLKDGIDHWLCVLKAIAGQLFPGVGSSVHSGGSGCSRCRGFLAMAASRGRQGCCGSGVASCFGRELPGGGSHSSAGDPALQSSVELILERTNLEPVSANL